MDAAQALLARYENHSRDEFSALAAAYRERLAAWRQETEAQARAQAQRQRVLEERARQTAQLIGSAAMLRPDVTELRTMGNRREPDEERQRSAAPYPQRR